MKRTICDRCGENVKKAYHMTVEGGRGEYSKYEIDLCYDCQDFLFTLIRFTPKPIDEEYKKEMTLKLASIINAINAE